MGKELQAILAVICKGLQRPVPIIKAAAGSKAVVKDIIILSVICVFFALGGGTLSEHPDAVVGFALRSIRDYGHPHFFHYPGFIIYLNSIVYSFIYIAMRLLGAVKNPADFTGMFYSRKFITHPLEIHFFLPGHIITVLFSVLAVASVYLLTHKLTGKRFFSFLSGLFVSTSLLWVADSHFATVDIPLSSLIGVSVLLNINAVTKEKLNFRQLSVLGLASGLVISTKYPGALLFLSIFSSLAFYYKKNYRELIKGLSIITVCAISVFITTNPFIFIDSKGFVKDFSFELAHAKNGHLGFHTDNAWAFHLFDSFFYGYGLLPLLLSLLGILWLISTRTVNISAKLAVIIFPFIFYVFMGSSKLAFQRYMLPVIPFLGVFSALGILSLYRLIQNRIPNKAKWLRTAFVFLLGLLTAVSVLPNVLNSLKHNIILTKTDTGEELSKILKGANLDTSNIDVVYGGCVIRRLEDAGIPVEGGRRIILSRDLSRINDSTDIIIFDSFSHDRLLYDNIHDKDKLSYKNYKDLYLIRISPFIKGKDEIPFSPKSLYSPYPPDLAYRLKPGPFIEIYVRDYVIVKKITDSCKKNGVAYSLSSGANGYYLRKIEENAKS